MSKWFDKRYHTLNYDLKTKFDKKVIKLSIDGGFTCPNRDGKISTSGCIFCSERGSGEYAGDKNLSIKDQLKQQIDLLKDKWSDTKYIAYFQNFTNTYAALEELKSKYEQALEFEDVVGISIGTRADCLEDDVIEYLKDLSKRTYLTLEIGLQTIHDKSAKFLRRGYNYSYFLKILKKLNDANINVVLHLIIGIPNETKKDMIETIDAVSKLNIDGVKLHLMHIIKNTDLQKIYEKEKFKTFEQEEYISFICDLIEKLNPNITIHRLTGDGSKETLIEPWWSLNKRAVLNGIDKELKLRDSYQGINFKS